MTRLTKDDWDVYPLGRPIIFFFFKKKSFDPSSSL